MSGIREQIAQRHGLPASFAERLKGDTPEELERDAAVLAVLRDRSSDKNPNQGELAALAAYTERKGELVKRLFGESVSTTPGQPPIEVKRPDPRRYGDGDG